MAMAVKEPAQSLNPLNPLKLNLERESTRLKSDIPWSQTALTSANPLWPAEPQRNEQKLHHLEEALPEAPSATATAAAEQELFETVKAFHAYKQEEGQSVSTYVLKMKAYLDQIERLGYPMPLVLGVNMILTSLSKDYDQVQSRNLNARHEGKGSKLEGGKSKLFDPQGLKGYQKLNKGALDLYVGNGNTAAVEAIGSFDLILPSGMIFLTTLQMSFWGYALESAARILNMVPTKKVNTTPYEMWHGKVPNLSYLKV
ncbi:hypothetical protein Tco_0559115 [Tanacetum coccineum]